MQELENFLERDPLIHAIVIADKDGVEVSRAMTESFREQFYTPGLVSVFSVIAEHAQRLQIGAAQSVTALYNSLLLLHLKISPQMVLTVIAEPHANVGVIRAQVQAVKADLSKYF